VAVAWGCAPSGTSNSVTIGDTTHVCITINNVTQAYFTPTADYMSRLTLNSSFEMLNETSVGLIQENVGWVDQINTTAEVAQNYYVSIGVTSMGVGLKDSAYRIYKNISYYPATFSSEYTTSVQVIPVLTAIIQVKNGAVTGVDWDDGCFFCSEGDPECTAYALNSSYSVSPTGESSFSCAQSNFTSSCVQETSTPFTNVCDLKLYVVWSGTDSQGNSFASAGLRFSQYRAYGIGSLYNSALSSVDSGLNHFHVSQGSQMMYSVNLKSLFSSVHG